MGADPRQESDVAIRASGLGKRYGATVALEALDLAIPAGRGVRLPRPERRREDDHDPARARPAAADAPGSVAVFGVDAWRDPVTAHRRIAFVAGEPHAVAGAHGPGVPRVPGPRCAAACDEATGGRWSQRFDFDPAKRVRDYSKGNRQKIQLIAAFSARADLLVLDEPTSGLDPLMEAAFRDTVAEARAAGQTVFLSSHILSEVEALCDRVGILREGRLVEEGTLAELRHLSARVVEATYDGARRLDSSLPKGVTVTAVGGNAPALRRARPGRAADRPAGRAPASSRSSAASRRSRSCSCPTTTAAADDVTVAG